MKKQWTILGAAALLSLALTACGETAKTETSEKEPWHTVVVKEAVELTSTEGEVDTDLLVGDVNGDGVVNGKDLLRLRQFIVSADPVTGENDITVFAGADANEDGYINSEDVVLLRRYIVSINPRTGEAGVRLGKISEGLAFTSNGDGTCCVSGIGTCTDTDIVIPTTSPDGDIVTTIKQFAFASSSSSTWLKSIILPDTLQSIQSNAFSNSTGLKKISIPNGTKTIGSSAFQGCTGLALIILPDSISSIGSFAFYNCTALSSVFYRGTKAQWDSIDMNTWNENLTGAQISYNYTD